MERGDGDLEWKKEVVEMISRGMSWRCKTCWTMSWVVSKAEGSLVKGTKWTALDNDGEYGGVTLGWWKAGDEVQRDLRPRTSRNR